MFYIVEKIILIFILLFFFLIYGYINVNMIWSLTVFIFLKLIMANK